LLFSKIEGILKLKFDITGIDWKNPGITATHICRCCRPACGLAVVICTTDSTCCSVPRLNHYTRKGNSEITVDFRARSYISRRSMLWEPQTTTMDTILDLIPSP